MNPVKMCYTHPKFSDVFIELLSLYRTSDGVKIKFRWWNRNSYYGECPYPLMPRPVTMRLKKEKWNEFKPVNYKGICRYEK